MGTSSFVSSTGRTGSGFSIGAALAAAAPGWGPFARIRRRGSGSALTLGFTFLPCMPVSKSGAPRKDCMPQASDKNGALERHL